MEIWKDIKGYEGKYQISTLGTVKSLLTNKEKKSYANPQGYLKVQLRGGKRGIYKNYFVHRIVAETFIVNTEKKKTVNHKNGIKDDNNVLNLEWCTQSENNYHKYRELNLKVTWTRKGADHPASRTVYMIDNAGTIVKIFGGLKEAGREMECCRVAISRAIKQEGKQYLGYNWKYA